jgi:anaerobic ribonucleoside-triphosphate reductase activating protein
VERRNASGKIVEIADAERVRVLKRVSPVSVLGPFERAVIWVQGCPLRCRGCITPEGLPFEGGELVPVAELADWIIEEHDGRGVEGVTFSGGEPFSQAAALCAVVDRARARRNIGVMCYSGFTHKHIQQTGSAEQIAFLARIDLLVDGPYMSTRHGDLLWRGSANQRLILLSDRYRAELERIIAEGGDKSAGLEIRELERAGLVIAGVPNTAGAGHDLRRRLAE